VSGAPGTGGGGPQKWLKQAKTLLISIAAVAILVRIIFWAVEPFIPYVISGLILIFILGVLINRSTKL
jgi:fatty acid desaturase